MRNAGCSMYAVCVVCILASGARIARKSRLLLRLLLRSRLLGFDGRLLGGLLLRCFWHCLHFRNGAPRMELQAAQCPTPSIIKQFARIATTPRNFVRARVAEARRTARRSASRDRPIWKTETRSRVEVRARRQRKNIYKTRSFCTRASGDDVAIGLPRWRARAPVRYSDRVDRGR